VTRMWKLEVWAPPEKRWEPIGDPIEGTEQAEGAVKHLGSKGYSVRAFSSKPTKAYMRVGRLGFGRWTYLS